MLAYFHRLISGNIMSILNNYFSSSIVLLRHTNKYELCLFNYLPFIFQCTISVKLFFWSKLTCGNFSGKKCICTEISVKYETREVPYLAALYFLSSLYYFVVATLLFSRRFFLFATLYFLCSLRDNKEIRRRQKDKAVPTTQSDNNKTKVMRKKRRQQSKPTKKTRDNKIKQWQNNKPATKKKSDMC